MSADLSLLELVIDDPLAPRVVAYWKASRAMLADYQEGADGLDARLMKMATITRAGSIAELEETLTRCFMAELFRDHGEVSDAATAWLNSRLMERFKIKPAKAKPAG